MELKTIFLLFSVISIAFSHKSSHTDSSESSNTDSSDSSHTDSSKSSHSRRHTHSSHYNEYEYYSRNSTEGARGIGGNEIGESCNKDGDCLPRLACDKYECVDPCSPNLCRYQRK